MPSSGKVEPLLVGREHLIRRAVAQIETELGRNRCVGLFGPRQVGKTTIARHIAARRGAGAILLDLRNPLDRKSLVDEQEFFAVHADKLVVLDECHLMPAALDIVHRRLEHEIHAREGATSFVVLGSSSVDLQRLAAERLGARLTPVLIDPIHLLELPDQRRPQLSTTASLKSPSVAVQAIAPSNDVIECDTLWLRGGFPR